MEEFLDDLLAKNPDGISVQIMAGGAPYSGAIRPTDHDGLYEMKIQSINPQTKEKIWLSVFVAAEHVASVVVVTDEMLQMVERPVSSLIVPRQS